MYLAHSYNSIIIAHFISDVESWPMCYNERYGALAQLIERGIRIAEVTSLILVRSTIYRLH